MKVIKKGNVPRTWTAKVGCRSCGAELQIEESDVKVETRPIEGWGGEHVPVGYRYFTCCECGSKQGLPSPLSRYLDRVRQAQQVRASMIDALD